MTSKAITPALTWTLPKFDLRPSRPPHKLKLPLLSTDKYKLDIRPRNGMPVIKMSSTVLSDGILREANLQPEGATNRARIEENQNIVIVSTPSPATAAALSKLENLTFGNVLFEV